MARKKRASIDDYLTIPQAIDFLEMVSKPTVYHWIKCGDLPSDLLGATKIVLKMDLISVKKAKGY